MDAEIVDEDERQVTDRPGEHPDEQDRAEEHQGPVVRDKRRIDPLTGEVREPAAAGPRHPPGSRTPRPTASATTSPRS